MIPWWVAAMQVGFTGAVVGMRVYRSCTRYKSIMSFALRADLIGTIVLVGMFATLDYLMSRA